MTDVNNNQMIQCPNCKAPLTIEELGEYVNANSQIKQQAIEEQLQLWGEVYDRNYLIQNVVFCPNCHKVKVILRTGLVLVGWLNRHQG